MGCPKWKLLTCACTMCTDATDVHRTSCTGKMVAQWVLEQVWCNKLPTLRDAAKIIKQGDEHAAFRVVTHLIPRIPDVIRQMIPATLDSPVDSEERRNGLRVALVVRHRKLLGCMCTIVCQ